MLGLFPLLVLAIVVAAVTWGVRAARGAPTPRVEPVRRRIPPVAEALGYLGGMLALGGFVLLVGRSWHDFGTGARLAVSLAATVLFVGAGVLVKERVDPAFARMRALLWLLGTIAAAVAAGVLARDVGDLRGSRNVAMVVAASVTVLSAALWQLRERPIQQLTCLAGLAVFVATAVARLLGTGAAGIAVWIVGAALVVAGWRERWSAPLVALGAGAIIAVAGGAVMSDRWHGAGLLVAVGTGIVLTAAGFTHRPELTRAQRIVATTVGAVSLLQTLPMTLGHFARHAGMATGLVVWGVGAALVALGWRRDVRAPLVLTAIGGLTVLGGAALTGLQAADVAPLLGIVTSLVLLGIGMAPGHVLVSIVGCAGLLGNVPWAIARWFPGSGRAPLLIMVVGGLILVVAVVLARLSGRMRDELGHHHWPHGHHGLPAA